MVVCNIVKPGTYLEGIGDRDIEFKLNLMISDLVSVFYEANLNLNLFEDERLRTALKMEANVNPESGLINLKFQEKQQRENAVSLELEREHSNKGNQFDPYSHDGRALIELKANMIAWQGGEIPSEFSSNLIFLYAKSFLFSLDSFDRFLGVLAKEEGVPESILSIHARIRTEFPSLRGVRNTAHHLEDRSRGLGDYSRKHKMVLKMVLKPIVNSAIHAPNGGVLILNQLNGSRYGCTMADGHFGEVDVSVESLNKLHGMLVGVFNAFSWSGPHKVYPRMNFW